LTSHTFFIVPDRQQTRFANFDAAMDIAQTMGNAAKCERLADNG
jgi:hypothetical protein